MNRHYKKALVEAALQQLQEEDINATAQEVETVLDGVAVTGGWNDDLHRLIEACRELAEEDEEGQEDAKERINRIVDSLKVGHNDIPGIGVGWCSSEDDLAKMREYVRGALTMQLLQETAAAEPAI